MLRIDNCEVMGWEHAIRGMRNPMNSWDRSDSSWGDLDCDGGPGYIEVGYNGNYCDFVGPNDAELMRKLSRGGGDDRKFMRMIVVYMDITAPLYWWKEFDTYKVGTVANSCSTMHKIAEKKFEISDFSVEHLRTGPESPLELVHETISMLNAMRDLYLETKDKDYWWQMIQLLPSSYNQRRTIMANYEVLRNVYHTRRNHKLDEWHVLCDCIERLPLSELMTGKGKSIAYICDGKACEDRGIPCDSEFCRHTLDVEHAKNFECVGVGKYVENDVERAVPEGESDDGEEG